MAIQSVNRAIDILSIFSPAQPRMGVTEISEKLKLSKPTVHGIIKTLADRGFIYRDPETRKYSLGLKVYELGTLLFSTLKINQVGAVPAHRLAESVNHMTRLAIWDDSSILITLNIQPGSQNPNLQQVCHRVPAYCSASGKSILASMPQASLDDYLKNIEFEKFTSQTINTVDSLLQDLEKIRTLGYAYDNGEYMSDLSCISNAVFDRTGNPVASISVSGDADFLKKNQLPTIIISLKQTATEISRSMGFIDDLTVR